MTPRRRSSLLRWLLLVAAVAGGLLLALLAGGRQRGPASGLPTAATVDPWEADSEKWGLSFPREFNTWESTGRVRPNTPFGGSAGRDALADDPRLVILFAGSPFAEDLRQPRGHFHSVEDFSRSGRVDSRTPAACWTCKSSDVPRLVARDGLARFQAHSVEPLRPEVRNPVGCLDCHEPRTMALRISRPALKDALARQGRDAAGIPRAEMRSLVCAQCHMEYLLEGKEGRLVLPWAEGPAPEDLEKRYAGSGHADWTHEVSGARMIKVEHPDYELYRLGVHSERGVACADCHMPGPRSLAEVSGHGGCGFGTADCHSLGWGQSGQFTDHGARSPLYNVAATCQACHRWTDAEVRARVEGIQARTREAMDRAERALVAAHLEIGDAARGGATEADLEGVRTRVRSAQLYWDCVAAANGMGFHAPEESLRILGKALDLAQECRLETQRLRARLGRLAPVELPDLSTREKARAWLEARKADSAGP